MIAMSPMDAALDVIAANLVGDFIGVMYGSLSGFLVMASLFVLSTVLLSIAKKEPGTPAAEQAVKMTLVLLFLGMSTETNVQIWMTGGQGSDTETAQKMEIGAGGETSYWLEFFTALPDAFVFPMVSMVSGEGTGVDSLYVYTLTAFQQVSTYEIENPALREDFTTWLGQCLPDGFLAIEKAKKEGGGGPKTWQEWVTGPGGSESFASTPDTAMTLKASGSEVKVTTCKQGHDEVFAAYQAEMDAQKGASLPEGIFEKMKAHVERTFNSAAEISFQLQLVKFGLRSVDATAGRFASPSSAQPDPGTALLTLDPLARGGARGELVANVVVGIAGVLDRLTDGGLTTKMMAIVMPAFLALARFAVILLFPFAFLSLGFTKRGEPFIYWFLALCYVKLQYLVMIVMLRLEVVLGQVLGAKLQEGPFSLEAVPQVQTFYALMSILFLGGTVTAAAVTASIFKLGPGMANAVGRMTGREVKGSVLGAVALGGMAMRMGGGVLRGASAGAGKAPGSSPGGVDPDPADPTLRTNPGTPTYNAKNQPIGPEGQVLRMPSNSQVWSPAPGGGGFDRRPAATVEAPPGTTHEQMEKAWAPYRKKAQIHAM